MKPDEDLVLSALEDLRDSTPEAEADPELEARLLELARARGHGRRKPGRWIVPGLAVVALSGAAFAGWGWIQRWWFEVEVDGHSLQGSLAPGESRTFTLDAEDGGTITVQVRSYPDPDEGARIDLVRRGPDGVDHEVLEESSIPPVLHPPERVAGRAPLHRGTGYELFLIPVGVQETCLALRRGDRAELVELERFLAEDLASGAVIDIREKARGRVTFCLTTPRGGDLEVDFFTLEDPEGNESESTSATGTLRLGRETRD